MINKSSLTISAIYLVLCILWILGSDTLVAALTQDTGQLVNIQKLKGIGFVILSSLLIYFLTAKAQNRLKKSEAKLSLLNKELEQRVRERTAKLEASNKELEAFNYMLSHDLRTPLRGIKMFTGLLEKKMQHSDEELKTYMHSIHEGADEMHMLIDDLLEYAGLRHKELRLESTNLQEHVQQTFELVKKGYPAKSVELQTNGLPTDIGIDPKLFRHLLMNLMENAFKYSKEGEKLILEVTAQQQEDGFRLVFKDNGIGFRQQFADKLFQPFHRLVGNDHSKGSGIGLSVCKRIVDIHQGTIWAEGEEDEGAAFYIQLPQQAVRA